MHRKILLGTTAVAGLLLIAACNQETATNTAPANTAPDQTAQNEPAPGSKNETISAAKDAVAGAVGTISAELTTSTKGFIDAAASGDNPDIKAFAAETMPKVQMHLDLIEGIDRDHRAAYAQASNGSGSAAR